MWCGMVGKTSTDRQTWWLVKQVSSRPFFPTPAKRKMVCVQELFVMLCRYADAAAIASRFQKFSHGHGLLSLDPRVLVWNSELSSSPIQT